MILYGCIFIVAAVSNKKWTTITLILQNINERTKNCVLVIYQINTLHKVKIFNRRLDCFQKLLCSQSQIDLRL